MILVSPQGALVVIRLTDNDGGIIRDAKDWLELTTPPAPAHLWIRAGVSVAQVPNTSVSQSTL